MGSVMAAPCPACSHTPLHFKTVDRARGSAYDRRHRRRHRPCVMCRPGLCAKKALRAGVSPDALRQIALIAMPTIVRSPEIVP